MSAPTAISRGGSMLEVIVAALPGVGGQEQLGEVAPAVPGHVYREESDAGAHISVTSDARHAG